MSEDTNERNDLSAVVRVVDGQIVLDDPVAVEVIRAIGKTNCKNTLRANWDRVQHFKQRIVELGKTTGEVVIVILNVDDVYGGPIAELLMPGHDWQEYRDRGEIPFARGLARRDFIQDALGHFDTNAAAILRDMTDIYVPVVVVDHGVAEIFVA